MSDEPTERDVEALIAAVPVAALKSRASVARAVLASNWYAARIADARREGAAEVWEIAAKRRSEARRYYVAWQSARMRAAALLRGDA